MKDIWVKIRSWGQRSWLTEAFFVFLVFATIERDLFPLPLFGMRLTMTTSEMSVALFVIWLTAWSWSAQKEWFVGQKSWAWMFLAFVAIAVLSSFHSEYPRQAVRFSVHLIAGFALFVAWNVFMGIRQTDQFIKALVVWDVVISVIAVFERYAYDRVWPWLSHLHNTPSFYWPRVSSIFDNPNVFGSYCAVIFGIVLVAFVTGRIQIGWLLAGSLAEMVSITLSGSRNAMFVMLVILAMSWMLFKRHRPVFTALLAIFALLIWSYPVMRTRLLHESSTLSGALSVRPEIWKAAIGAWRDHLWIGVGPGVFRLINGQYGGPGGNGVYHAHSIFLDFSVSMGILGLCWLTACVGVIGMKLHRFIARGGSPVVAWPFLAAFLSQTFFDYYLDHSLPYGVVFWMATAYSLKLAETEDRSSGVAGQI